MAAPIGSFSADRMVVVIDAYVLFWRTKIEKTEKRIIFVAENVNNNVSNNVNVKTVYCMSIEEAIMGGIVFKGKKDKPKGEEKVKTKAKKATYIRGQHGSGAAKMKAEIRRKRANRHKNK